MPMHGMGELTLRHINTARAASSHLSCRVGCGVEMAFPLQQDVATRARLVASQSLCRKPQASNNAAHVLPLPPAPFPFLSRFPTHL